MKPLKETELLKCAGSEQDAARLRQIFDWRRQVFATNEFVKDETPFTVRLCGLELNFKPSSAFTAIETVQELFVDEGHCKHTAFLPETAGTILDIGANQGLYAVKVMSRNPACRIYSFEPNPFEFEFLKKNFAANGALMANAKAEQLAVSGKGGKFRMEIIPEMGPIGGVALRTPGRKWIKDEFVREITADSVTLDGILEQRGLARVDILKMDVEGAELEILNNFHGFKAIDKAVIEYHSLEGKAELEALLAGNGLKLVLDDRYPGDLFGDAYFLRT